MCPGAKKGLRRESNPGHPHPKRVFYHLTTKPPAHKGNMSGMTRGKMIVVCVILERDVILSDKRKSQKSQVCMSV